MVAAEEWLPGLRRSIGAALLVCVCVCGWVSGGGGGRMGVGGVGM